MTEPRGLHLSATVFVDSSNAENCSIQKSHTGSIILLNREPVYWYSKHHKTAKSNSSTSEFISLKVFVEAIQGLRSKLRMFGIPVYNEGNAKVFCDNESVVKIVLGWNTHWIRKIIPLPTNIFGGKWQRVLLLFLRFLLRKILRMCSKNSWASQWGITYLVIGHMVVMLLRYVTNI